MTYVPPGIRASRKDGAVLIEIMGGDDRARSALAADLDYRLRGLGGQVVVAEADAAGRRQSVTVRAMPLDTVRGQIIESGRTVRQQLGG